MRLSSERGRTAYPSLGSFSGILLPDDFWRVDEILHHLRCTKTLYIVVNYLCARAGLITKQIFRTTNECILTQGVEGFSIIDMTTEEAKSKRVAKTLILYIIYIIIYIYIYISYIHLLMMFMFKIISWTTMARSGR